MAILSRPRYAADRTHPRKKGRNTMNILLVEDEVSLSNAIKRILEKRGYLVDAVYDGLSAIDYAKGMEQRSETRT